MGEKEAPELASGEKEALTGGKKGLQSRFVKPINSGFRNRD
jgi:hypothetical protein